jgi:flagellar basal-body rod protein FlgB
MAQSIGILEALKGRMQWHQTRQKLLAENVANADTPKFKPNDLVAYADTLGGSGRTGLSRTAVNLEDEMMKVSENQMEFQTAITLYQKSLGYLRIAVGRR